MDDGAFFRLRCLATPPASMATRLMGTFQAQEIIYQNIVHEACRRLGIERPFYPLKAAANYGLLYLLLRLCTDTSIRTVLELGAGQSTLLLDGLRRTRDLDIVTLESDAGWAGIIGPQVAHEVVHAPLQQVTIEGTSTGAYGIDRLGDRRFDLVVVDGPEGTPRRSRWGALPIIDGHLADDYVVVIDDVQRRGEIDTAKQIHQKLAKRAACHLGLTTASKTQMLLASDKFRFAAYF